MARIAAGIAAKPSRITLPGRSPTLLHLVRPFLAHGVGTTAVDGRCTLKADGLTHPDRPITSRGQCPLYGVLRSRPRTYGGRVFCDAMTSAISATPTWPGADRP